MDLVRFSQDMDGYMEVSKDGDWVNYSSATEAIDELRRTVAEQKEMIAAYTTKHSNDEAFIQKLFFQCDAQSALIEKLAKALKMVEYVAYDDPDWGSHEFCPSCSMEKKHTHYECRTEEALAAYEQYRNGGK